MRAQTQTTESVDTREACRISGLAYITIMQHLQGDRIDGARRVDGRWRIPRQWAERKRAERVAKAKAKATPNGGNGK
jgi:hypothetical protein